MREFMFGIVLIMLFILLLMMSACSSFGGIQDDMDMYKKWRIFTPKTMYA